MEMCLYVYSRFIVLGLQGSAWLVASVEEALKVSAKEFVKYFRDESNDGSRG